MSIDIFSGFAEISNGADKEAKANDHMPVWAHLALQDCNDIATMKEVVLAYK